MTVLKLQTSGGINNKSQSETMSPPFVAQAINLDFADNGEIRKRPGQTKIISCTTGHSVFEFDSNTLYFVDNGTLKRRDLSAGETTTIKTGIGDEKLSYAVSGGRIYYSNGIVNGSVVDDVYRSWGVSRPARQPDLSVSPVGGLVAGIYFVAITYLRNGEESGTGEADQITVEDGGGIVLSNFPTPPADVDRVAIYVTPCNGKKLYLFGEYRADISTVTIGHHIGTIELNTQFGRPPLMFSCVAAQYGRVYGAWNSYVYYSEPMRPGLFMPNNYLPFSGDVKLIVAVKSALYVVADKTYRIGAINDEGVPVIIEVLPFSAVSAYAKDPAETLAVWMSEKGFVVATEEVVQLLAYDRIAVDKYTSGAITIIDDGGFKKVIGTFK